MCKHILNAQVTVRAPCCQRFFDCPQCHAESSDHPLRKTTEMAFVCKACKRAFRKDLSVFEESDEYCPWCDNCYVISAKTSQRRPPPPPEATEQDTESGATSSSLSHPNPLDARHDSSLYEALDPRIRYDPRHDFHTTDTRATEDGERVDVGGLRGVMEGKALREREAQRRMEELMQMAGTGAGGGAGDAAGGFQHIDDELDWS
ncbi:hypothetical protein BCV69DRAFT_280028 [Microstroma glucosiphilum]|uniref:CHY-type domain-containing protein n=1 Tax=Pseudomicrostroma glucosiphilum TaxID=1684307 RepID=A0A316UFU8_9BASI|nr:hypothetical protein BCV69DRAFT_280028 [Pseudomicrostroma glucosiphilum]PWN24126.1 hypothetical protein BCV69DRAFT_280028 [Pseudomicrostroma glucosiphilum]